MAIYGSSQTDPRYSGYSAPQTSSQNPLQWMGENLLAGIGTTLSLPERGWSEIVGGKSFINPSSASAYEPVSGPMSTYAPQSTGTTSRSTNTNTGIVNPPQPTPTPTPDKSNYTQDALGAMRNSVSNAYDPIMSKLDEMAGYIPQWRTEKEGAVNNSFNNQSDELNASNTDALNQLGVYRNQVAQNQAKSVRDLSQNMQKMLQAGNVYLGNSGAGDSSAAKMYAFALSKAAGQGSAQISGDAGKQYNDLNIQQSNVKSTFDTNVAKLKEWKNTQLSSISDWANSQLMNIQSQKANAVGQRAQALAAAEQGIIQNALSYLQNLDSQATQWQDTMQKWAVERMASLDDARIKLGQQAQYNVQDIYAPQLQGINSPIASNVNNQYMSSNPYLMQLNKKKDEFGQLING